MRFVKELEGDVVDRPLVDVREAVGPGAKSTIVDMVDDVGVSLPEYYRHPRCFSLLPRSPSMGNHVAFSRQILHLYRKRGVALAVNLEVPRM